jgi:FMN phosphatase YigB (HAD superfamily)
VVERSDEYIIGRLIERSRLLIALSDEIPVETKLQTQPLLKQLEQALSVPPAEQDEERVRGTYAALYGELADYADLEALLAALKNFVPYL